MSSTRRDTVFLHGIRGSVSLLADAWGRANKPQPYAISVEIHPDLEKAGRDDDVAQTADYSSLRKRLVRELEKVSPTDLTSLVRSLRNDMLSYLPSYELKLHLPKACLRAADGLKLSLSYFSTHDPLGENQSVHVVTYQIAGMRVGCIVGVNAHERLRKQDVVITLEFEIFSFEVDDMTTLAAINNRTPEIEDRVAAFVEGSSFQTVEGLATAVARLITMEFDLESIEVQIDKPSAIATVDAAGVRLHRKRSFFANQDFWRVKQS